MMNRKIGIYGGAFDPPHKGHLDVVKTVLKECKLDSIHIVPSHKNLFGKRLSDFNERIELCKKTFCRLPKISVDDSDRYYDGSTYSLLKNIVFDLENSFFIIGSDAMLNVPKWKYAPQVRKNVNFIVIHRKRFGLPATFFEKYKIKYYIVKKNPIDISSTDLRLMIKNGEWKKAEKYMAPEVLQEIKEKNLTMNGHADLINNIMQSYYCYMEKNKIVRMPKINDLVSKFIEDVNERVSENAK